MKLDKRVAIVTGAGGGIGRAIALAFIREGAAVAALDINPASLRSLEAEAGVGSDRLIVRASDATARPSIDEAVGQVLSAWGRVDILVNNVGGGIGTHSDSTLVDEGWNATLALNLTGCFAFIQAVAGQMRQQNYGRVVNISSSGGRYRSNTGASNIAYAAAKGGVLQLTRTVAHALGRDGITVNAIAPGLVLTPAGREEEEALKPALRERVLRETPLGYFCDPSEIASIAVFLASSDASYITGTTILANGGWCTS